MTTIKLAESDNPVEIQLPLRPAAVVMSPERARAAYPTPLSFSRSLVRKMLRQRWRIERARFELDSEGRGEALYRIFAADCCFHFFAISNVFPADQKIDRSFGINWDVSAAICQGEWTADREALLRDEIPKQYSGRYDTETLGFCRGNRSERLFDHVVDSLVAGDQPDATLLATVGYILRSTAFAGNGLFGIKPFEGLGFEHPLGRPYEVQILAAYMLREFVFDLVEGIAAARSPRAAKLDRRLKRYLGIGNSAGLGLIPFVANHPQIVHQWCLVNEEALAAAMVRSPSATIADKFLSLLAKAEQYFRQDPRDGNGIFASFGQLASEIAVVRSKMIDVLKLHSANTAQPWQALLAWIGRDFHPELVEVVHAILLELYPNIVETCETRFQANEFSKLEPQMTVGVLRSKLRIKYDWFLSRRRNPGDLAYFWYYPVEAPDEPRRGLRGVAPEFEFESKMDLPLRLDELAMVLEIEPDDTSVAGLLAKRPNLRAVVARVQSTADLEYAELRENFLSASFTPFSACRFVLAFYGMEKYDPRPPRSTKGSLLQGAPIADEIPTGKDGDWPFPLIPDLGQSTKRRSEAMAFVPLRVIESGEISAQRVQELAKTKRAPARKHETRVFPLEYRRLVTKSLVSGGYSLGTAESVARLAEFCETLGERTLEELITQIKQLPARPEVQYNERDDFLDAADTPAFAAALLAGDLACARANSSIDGAGVIAVSNVRPSGLLLAATYRMAEHGVTAVCADLSQRRLYAASRDAAGLTLLQLINDLSEHMTQLLDRTGIASLALGSLGEGSFAMACLARASASQTLAALTKIAESTERVKTTFWRSKQIKCLQEEVYQTGLRIAPELFSDLLGLAKRTLVPEAIERLIVGPQ